MKNDETQNLTDLAIRLLQNSQICPDLDLRKNLIDSAIGLLKCESAEISHEKLMNSDLFREFKSA